MLYLLYMLIVKVKEKGGIERALKELKSKVIKVRQARELNERKVFKKKSVKQRERKNKAIYVDKKFKRED
jgi:ribosomal protein S21